MLKRHRSWLTIGYLFHVMLVISGFVILREDPLGSLNFALASFFWAAGLVLVLIVLHRVQLEKGRLELPVRWKITTIGSILAFGVLGYFGLVHGWHNAFLIMAVLYLLISVVNYRLVARAPDQAA